MEIVDPTMKPTKWEIDSGMGGPYIAIGHLFFESPVAMGAALGSAGEASANISSLTNAEAAFQISEVIA